MTVAILETHGSRGKHHFVRLEKLVGCYPNHCQAFLIGRYARRRIVLDVEERASYGRSACIPYGHVEDDVLGRRGGPAIHRAMRHCEL